ncbi:non-ribosomal peptide synthetase [Aspergillus brunneoviolaceus CBS 621.78]|uniref:Acetyl-CoA synthetase-like protein n=1 Tax=Aspergillus brunneoviolaceus CBS 621.78 TaxID=1450534 RepID=A0ACD1G5T8_9EURO|nr:acetyl-CoA synthetase-like protein [Aspergillus brunneoviolaceus CBS 621.78]RAH44623.1 acetyl-CoA synthetase-like protein [Aspergillus brunneoviolaceus CBS 621.78]
MAFRNLVQLLDTVASERESGQIICYPSGSTKCRSTYTYHELLHEARQASQALRRRGTRDLSVQSPVLLHFTVHWDNIVWFWAVMLAGRIPVMSTALPNSPFLRTAHLKHLSVMLKHPLCLTRESQMPEFRDQEAIQPVAVESLNLSGSPFVKDMAIDPGPEDTAVMLLTSGSTGNCKAVCLSHGQILAANVGKLSVIPLAGESLMNWVHLDHVAGLVEIHLQAMLARMDQVHVPGSDLLSSPTTFLDLIDTHRVCRTFAPNFFLAKLRVALENLHDPPQWDLSCLQYIASGGEANVTRTCVDISKLLSRYGTPSNVIVPGFGMTETCAGSIFNTRCPEYDQDQKLEFAAVGRCMPGIQVRITDGSPANTCVPPGEIGNLEVTGPVVFKSYFNNAITTADSFTSDGWFKTGDHALLDCNGYVVMAGRAKDTIIVNGLKYNPLTIERALEDANIPGLTPTYNCCFCSLPPGGETEEVCMVYVPTYQADDMVARVETTEEISKTVMMCTGARPQVIPLPKTILQKTALGKLSRAQIKGSYERGEYQPYQEVNSKMVKLYRSITKVPPRDELESTLLAIFTNTLGLEDEDFGVQSPLLDLGVTSIELIKLKKALEERLDLSEEIPIITLLKNQTIRALGDSLRDLQKATLEAPHIYNPTPLWLIHPGVGEVLVFLNLTKYIQDRPVFALRARGFNESEQPFDSIGEAVATYHAAIKRTQREGPYAIAGYSYGAMLAFETSKRLEQYGDTVGFLGSFNLPPHIRSRMRQLDFRQCLLHLAYFLDLMSEGRANDLAAGLGDSISQEEALEIVWTSSDSSRLTELALTKHGLLKWACLAFGLQRMAVEYEPSGSVVGIDCFYCVPLAGVASSKRQWYDEHMVKWKDFARSEPRFHDVAGAHYTMLSPEHVFGFQKTLRRALEDRGL